MPEVNRNIEKIKHILAHSIEQAKPYLKKLHASDLALLLADLSPDARRVIIQMLPVVQASEVLSEMDEETNPEELLLAISTRRAVEIVEELDPDDAADLLAQLEPEDLRVIMDRLSLENKTAISNLMTYPEDSAGGIMNPEVIKIPYEFNKRQAIEMVIEASEEMEDFYAIYIVDKSNRVQGVISLKSLIKARPWVSVSELMEPDLVTINVNADQEEAARKIQQYNLPALPVVDDEMRLLGRITFDDVMDVLEEESTEDILKMAGVSEEEELRGNWINSVRSRLPWLLINLVTASLAGFVISRFSNTLDQLVIIASFMPVVAGVAGNGATQTLAVTIRRIATDGVLSKQYISVIRKELIVGFVNGMVLGTTVGLIAWGINANPKLGLVVFMALVGNLLIAAFAGSAIPLLLQRLDVDPAVASSILMTAFTDILGYTLLLGLGSVILL